MGTICGDQAKSNGGIQRHIAQNNAPPAEIFGQFSPRPVTLPNASNRICLGWPRPEPIQNSKPTQNMSSPCVRCRNPPKVGRMPPKTRCCRRETHQLARSRKLQQCCHMPRAKRREKKCSKNARQVLEKCPYAALWENAPKMIKHAHGRICSAISRAWPQNPLVLASG